MTPENGAEFGAAPDHGQPFSRQATSRQQTQYTTP